MSLRSLSVVLCAAFVLVGCGGGGGNVTGGTGRVHIVHVSVSEAQRFADRVEITPLARGGAELRPTVQAAIQAEYTFENIPDNAVTILLEYLKSGVVIARTRAQVDLSDGSEEIDLSGDPAGQVHFIKNDTDHVLMVGGIPIFIKGVGFDYTQLDQTSGGSWFAYVDPAIGQVGANCIRLYGIPWTDGGVTTPGSPAYQAAFTSKMLQYAANHSAYVLVGVFVDGSATNSRVTQFINMIQGDANFSRVIGYCVGNEVGESNFGLVNSLAGMIKGLQTTPAQVRPIMTALPAVSAGYVPTIQSTMPNLDWLGINTFYGQFDAAHAGGGYLNTQAASLKSGGWTKPWAITEYYSYDIHSFDMPKQVMNGFGMGYMLECNSTLNAQNYANSYSQYIASSQAKQDGSVGGFVLNYGAPHNSKLIASWLEPFTYTGQFTPFVNPPWNSGANQFIRLGATDAVAALYGGNFGNSCPQIVLGADNDPQGISCSFKATLSSAGTPQAHGQAGVTATVIAKDSDPLTFAWYLIGGSSAGSFSGDITAPGLDPQAYEQPTTIYLGGGVSSAGPGSTTNNTLTFTLPVPKQSGQNNYQLRVIVFDSHGGGATAAIGFPMQ